MKQILQNLGTGETLLAEVPCPRCGAGAVLIETTRSLVSLGTEKMLLDFGKGSLLDKARQQPDKVKQVLQKIRTDGLWATLDAVKAKLDQPIPLGYSNVGVVIDSAADSQPATFNIGVRVVSNGPHAGIVALPHNLTARIPDGVTDDQAAFTVVGAIGLQGIRLLHPTLGERFVVSGLGLIGLLSVQMLRAHGCQVLGIDFDPKKLELARRFGATTVDLGNGEEPVAAAEQWSNGAGVDGVLITASTQSDELVHQAATMCRKRGRIVLVGVVGLNLRRDDFYKKEITFQVSCSYGPGRYEAAYEKQGMDYPVGFVRWTEQRNFEAVLGLMADGRLDVAPLISHRFKFDDALRAYEVVGQGGALGILLDYGEPTGGEAKRGRAVMVAGDKATQGREGKPGIAFIGAGNFTTRMLLPAMAELDVRRKAIVSSTGVSGTHAARKFGFEQSTTDAEAVLADPEVNAVFITTPHQSHARLVCKALAAGKHVFVEKPLCLTLAELDQIRSTLDPQLSTLNPLLMVGFNRRFSPHTEHMKKCLAAVPGPKAIVITVNAGAIPADHWTQNPAIGGGRIVGEACHFIDLARHLANSPITHHSADFLGGAPGRLGDCAMLHLQFEDGSIATIHYLANGHKGFPKERIEVFAGGRVIQCDNFRRTSGHGYRGIFKTRSQDKGHAAGLLAFVKVVREGGRPPIPLSELFEVSRVTIELAEQFGQRQASRAGLIPG